MIQESDVELIVTAIKDISSKRRLVVINYEPAFALYNSELRRYHIKENQTISPADYHEIVEELLTKRATVRAMSLLKSKDYAEAELVSKLKTGHYPDVAIEHAITYVKNYGYIDDRRYVDNYIQFKASQKSKRQIVQFLSNKGIDRHMIEQACEEFYDQDTNPELDLLIRQIEKKRIDPDNFSYEEKQKLLNSFYRKGFQIDLVKKALDIVLEQRYND